MIETFLLIHLSTAGVLGFVSQDFCKDPKPGRVWEIGNLQVTRTYALACGFTTPSGVFIRKSCRPPAPSRYVNELECRCGELAPKDREGKPWLDPCYEQEEGSFIVDPGSMHLNIILNDGSEAPAPKKATPMRDYIPLGDPEIEP